MISFSRNISRAVDNAAELMDTLARSKVGGNNSEKLRNCSLGNNAVDDEEIERVEERDED